MKQTILFAMAVIVMASCTTTKYVPIIEHHTDTLIQTKVQKDSIWLHDSIHVTEKGDTVWIERWHIKWQTHLEHDTVYKARTDSVPVPYPVIKEVEKPRSKVEKGLMGVGILSIMALVIFIAFKLKRFLP